MHLSQDANIWGHEYGCGILDARKTKPADTSLRNQTQAIRSLTKESMLVIELIPTYLGNRDLKLQEDGLHPDQKSSQHPSSLYRPFLFGRGLHSMQYCGNMNGASSSSGNYAILV